MNLNSKIVGGVCGTAAVAVVAAGIYVAAPFADSSSSGSASSSGQSADDTISMPEVSLVDAAIDAADSPDEVGSPGDSAAPDDRTRPRLRHPLRARRLFRGVHGEATVRSKDGFMRVAWQRGQVTAVSGTQLTVRSADGASWQWTTNKDTQIRRHGDKAALSQLAVNDWIFVVGPISDSTRTARAAVVPRRVPKNAMTPAPSAS